MASDHNQPEPIELDPSDYPRLSRSVDHGRITVHASEMEWGDRLNLPHPYGKPVLWRPIVVGIKKRRRKKGGYVVEVRGRIDIQFEEDELTVIDRPSREEVNEEWSKTIRDTEERLDKLIAEDEERQRARAARPKRALG